MNLGIIILAAGHGARFGGYKQFSLIGKKTLLDIAVEKYKPYASSMVIVVPEGFYKDMVKRYKSEEVVVGGETRLYSIKNGFLKFKDMIELPDSILIVDAVRPNTSNKLIENIIKELETNECVIPVIKAYETTIKYYTLPLLQDPEFSNYYIEEPDLIYFCQTPEGYSYDKLKLLLDYAQSHGFNKSGFLMAYYGQYFKESKKLKIINGEKSNIKINDRFDLEIARFIMKKGN
ncbi:MAG: 2-C-methyl-D-erythritol 4-phosphate cytidylyltransferase [bacterium]